MHIFKQYYGMRALIYNLHLFIAYRFLSEWREASRQLNRHDF